VRESIESAYLFSDLSNEQIDAITRLSEIVRFDAGDVITQADKPGEAAFLIVSGTASVEDGTPASGFQEPLGPGTFIGELAMLSEVTYSATVVAAEPVQALEVSRAALYEVMERDPLIAEHILEKLTARLSHLADELRAVDERFEALEESLERASEGK